MQMKNIKIKGTSLVPYSKGSTQNTLKIKINSYSRALTRPTATQIAIFIGTLLGDGYLFINPDGGKNARFGHLQAARSAGEGYHQGANRWSG